MFPGWLRNTSYELTAGVGATNGIDYGPIFVRRATEVTRELGTFLGLQLNDVLQPEEPPATPVVLFGFDNTYTEAIVQRLTESNFDYLVVASDAEFAPLREESQDHYSNMGTADVHDAAKVESVLSNSPFDQHLIIDIPPKGPRALGAEGGSLLDRYGELFASLAKKAKGEGRLATVTLLSVQMPDADSLQPTAPLSAMQKACYQDEQAWVAFGKTYGVRVVVLRVAERLGP